MPNTRPAADSPSAFAKWTRDYALDGAKVGGSVLSLMHTADAQTIRLAAEVSKRADQIVKLLGPAVSAEVRDAAVAEVERDDGMSDIVSKATISTERVDSYNSTLSVEGWEKADYKRNPVVLFAHEAYKLPVGRDIGVHADLGTRALKGVTRFVGDALGAQEAKIGKWVAAGVLNATSVGFEPIEAVYAEERDDGSTFWMPLDFVRQALREYSWVPVPANPDCIVDGRSARAAGVDPAELRRMLEEALDGVDAFYIPRRTLLALKRATEPAVITVDLGDLGTFEVRDARADLVCPECGHTGPAETFAPEAEGDESAEQPGVDAADGEAVADVDESDAARHDDVDAREVADMAADVLEVLASGRLP